MSDWDLFADVRDITAWLDESNPASPHEDSMRVLKLVEESGEAAAAYIGMVGQNPRKGVTHTQTDLLSELADVAITALCAMQHFTQDSAVTRGMLAAKAAGIIARADIPTRSLAWHVPVSTPDRGYKLGDLVEITAREGESEATPPGLRLNGRTGCVAEIDDNPEYSIGIAVEGWLGPVWCNSGEIRHLDLTETGGAR